MHWKKVTLVGVGLLGGSLGQALKARNLADGVSGYVRRQASIAECEGAGAVDAAGCDLEAAVKGADLIVLCTPIAQMKPLASQMRAFLKPGAVVTDVGSVKGSVVRDLESLLSRAGAFFVGSHPMAGSEKTGVSAASPSLFEGSICAVTPTQKTNRQALRAVTGLWQAVGARVLRLDPSQHDELVSRSSHLPHVVAAQLANFVLNPKRPAAQARLCANGFRDCTRVASGSPEMWRDITVANRKHLGRALDGFIRDLQKLRKEIARGEPARIQKFFSEAKRRRDHWLQQGVAASPE